MDTSELCEEWDDMTASEKLEAMKDVINDTLEEAGYSPVKVESDDLSEVNSLGNYRDDTVTFDDSHVEGDDLPSVLDTAYHETAHAMEDQDGDFDALTDEEREDYTDQGMNFVLDSNDEPVGASDDLHDDVRDYADYKVGQHQCEETDQSTESPADDGFDFEIDWDNATVTDEPADAGDASSGGSSSDDDVFEIDWDNAVITDEPADAGATP